MEIPLEEALVAFYFSTATGMVTNAVKLVPLGQLEGKNSFWSKENIDGWVQKTMTLEEKKIGLSNVGFDLRSWTTREIIFKIIYELKINCFKVNNNLIQQKWQIEKDIKLGVV